MKTWFNFSKTKAQRTATFQYVKEECEDSGNHVLDSSEVDFNVFEVEVPAVLYLNSFEDDISEYFVAEGETYPFKDILKVSGSDLLSDVW